MSFNFSATPSGHTTSSGSGAHLSADSAWDNLFNDEDEDRNDDIATEVWIAKILLILKHFANKDCIILLVDAQPLMFEKNERDEIPFHNAIKCAIATLTDKIISSENDLLGICFYGTVNYQILTDHQKSKKNPNEFENIYVFSELESPDPHKILELENILSSLSNFII